MKSVIFILAILLSSVSFGQERVNREKLSFDTTSLVLSKANGWAFNSVSGEWVDYENVISDVKDYKEKYASLQGEWMMSRISQNFKTIQTKTFTYKGTSYFIIMVTKWSGAYKYPNIKEDWYTFELTIGYIFTKEEYQKLFNINNSLELKTKRVVYLGSKYESYDETKFLDLIQLELSKETNIYSIEYKFPILKSEEGAIRFYLPDYFSKYTGKIDFEKAYFETKQEDFELFLIK